MSNKKYYSYHESGLVAIIMFAATIGFSLATATVHNNLMYNLASTLDFISYIISLTALYASFVLFVLFSVASTEQYYLHK